MICPMIDIIIYAYPRGSSAKTVSRSANELMLLSTEDCQCSPIHSPVYFATHGIMPLELHFMPFIYCLTTCFDP